MIWSLIGSIGGNLLDIVDNVVEDKDEANRPKFEIQRLGLCLPLSSAAHGCLHSQHIRPSNPTA